MVLLYVKGIKFPVNIAQIVIIEYLCIRNIKCTITHRFEQIENNYRKSVFNFRF